MNVKTWMLATTWGGAYGRGDFRKDMYLITRVASEIYGYKGKMTNYHFPDETPLPGDVQLAYIDEDESDEPKKLDDLSTYILKNAKDIDVLHQFHPTFARAKLARMYKKLNPNGKTYLKMDSGGVRSLHEKLGFIEKVKSRLGHLAWNRAFRAFDVISVESRRAQQEWSSVFPKLEFTKMSNGFYDGGEFAKNSALSDVHAQIPNEVSWDEKEDVILFVGRAYDFQKNLELLFDAFILAVKDLPDSWKLRIVGPYLDPVQKTVENYLAQVKAEHPDVFARIELVGPTYDDAELEAEYRRAKVFALPSRWESFGIVYVEAQRAGCRIVTTDTPAAPDVLGCEDFSEVAEGEIRRGPYGLIVANGWRKDFETSVQLYAQALTEACSNQDLLQTRLHETQRFAWDNFYWPTLLKAVIDKLQ